MKCKWSRYRLSDIAKFTTGKLNSNAAVENGKYPFFTCAPEPLSINTYKFDEKAIILAGNNAEGNFHISFYEGKFNAYQRTYVITSKEENTADIRYLYYALKLCLAEFKIISQGTATKFLTAKILSNFEIILPPIHTQKKIVSVLCDLDDKIELNNSINNNLEQQAQAVFKSWFVDFEPFGNVMPSDWEPATIETLSKEIICGKTPSTKKTEYYGNDIPFITIPDMHNNTYIINTERYLSKLGADTQKGKTLPENSVCVSCIGTAGLVSLVSRDSQTNQQINSIIPKDNISPFFVYLLMQTLAETIQRLGAGGSTICNLNKGQFSNIPIFLPNLSVLDDFDKIINPMFAKIKANQKENVNLTQLRDTLLPKLMSGELGVSSIEI